MTRIKTGSIRTKRHKKIIKLNKGFRGSNSKLFKAANQKTLHSLSYSHIDRKKKKREYKKLWIQRINGIVRKNNSKYNLFINKIKTCNILINKKILANLAFRDEKTFNFIINLSEN
uniref:Large ribosomal subunit protein bL20c n=1 Tax=Discoplastis spathirhyncha TaxID=215771 RepID=A0A3G3LLD1_9EUGL|nr:ribosomal protein L20 [Discoplastis spathirhyncha]AYQ93509.1 ribosomal protein L20 [Discoplastis spathirhyncha]